ncbi:DUF3019 domain-containing protein [Lacimicrobium alkaliphilum]|uniref:DUF3019 domain-containing protein n=1 Tax=Lacimicrobium alkaliphilum TaxID=1526571 RepID=A0ABQ1RKV8_9ALTE|nr:DUF3019 domain-containing protein [Lacimicrobium alkaliphilum]GGD70276.1 hypothetical protein GCM10011357_26680 [Lacimicrobium alkaliphilum]
MKQNGLWLTLLFMLGWSQALQAEPAGWRIKPNICVVEQIGDACELQLDISLWGEIPQHSCLFIQDSQVQCWAMPDEKISITLQFREASVISMRDSDDQTLLQETLEIKSLSRIRQRVRTPWSVF